MKELTNNNLAEFEKIKEKKVMILSAPWCGPCRALIKKWDETDFENVYHVDLTSGRTGRYKRTYNIQHIPLSIIFENGFEVDRIEGDYDPYTIIDGSQDQA